MSPYQALSLVLLFLMIISPAIVDHIMQASLAEHLNKYIKEQELHYGTLSIPNNTVALLTVKNGVVTIEKDNSTVPVEEALLSPGNYTVLATPGSTSLILVNHPKEFVKTLHALKEELNRVADIYNVLMLLGIVAVTLLSLNGSSTICVAIMWIELVVLLTFMPNILPYTIHYTYPLNTAIHALNIYLNKPASACSTVPGIIPLTSNCGIENITTTHISG